MAVHARIALFVLEALPNARAVRRFVADHAAEIALVGLSNAERPSAGGLLAQARRHLARSGRRFLPYLAVNFGLPDLLKPLAPMAQALAGSRDAPEATPLRTLCARRGIRSLSIDDVNGGAVKAALAESGAELIVTFHFDQILKAETLAAVPLGGINVHPSLLPRHRGPVPTIHALADEDWAFGVTVHRLVPEIDAGAILAQEAVPLPADVTATRAAILLHERGRPLLEGVLNRIAEKGTVPDGDHVAPMPYRGFPDAAMLARMQAQNQRLCDGRDLREALALSSTKS